MTAAAARRRLALLITRSCPGRSATIAILAAADRYRDAAVGEAIARATAGQLITLGLAEAEEHRRGTA